jgi:predicted metal-dependent hydrolase
VNAVPEPQLDADELRVFQVGVAQFNDGYYFECHDTLEDVWNGVRGPARDFFQGLIQISVAFHHLSHGNRAGAESLFGRALKRLAKYPDRYWTFDVAGQRAAIETWRALLQGETLPQLTPETRPRWSFEPPVGVPATQ